MVRVKASKQEDQLLELPVLEAIEDVVCLRRADWHTHHTPGVVTRA